MPTNITSTTGNTVDVIPVAAITGGTLVFEGTLATWYTRDAVAGQKASPTAWNTTLKIEKDTPANTYAVGDVVEFNTTTQKTTATGTAMGICAEASLANELTVRVRLNSG